MHEQSRHNQAVQPRDWTHHYFTPGDSDKCASCAGSTIAMSCGVPDAWHSCAQITEANCFLIAATSRYVSLLCFSLLYLKAACQIDAHANSLTVQHV